MGGQLGETVNELVKQFNQSQAEYEVKALNKGTYPEVLTSAIAAYRQKNPPHIVQVFEVGTQTMLLSGAISRSRTLLKQQEIAVNWDDFIGPVTGYYSKDGKLYSMPFNSSSPILYYNKDAFKKAGSAGQAARHLEGGRGRLPEDPGRRRRQVRLHHLVAVVDDAGEHLRLAQSSPSPPTTTATRASTPSCSSTASSA